MIAHAWVVDCLYLALVLLSFVYRTGVDSGGAWKGSEQCIRSLLLYFTRLGFLAGSRYEDTPFGVCYRMGWRLVLSFISRGMMWK
jgi:hypothetical protein